MRADIEQLNGDELAEIFRKIYAREREHGHFLTAFAEAFILADPINRRRLDHVARQLVEVYNLIEYCHQPGREPRHDTHEHICPRCQVHYSDEAAPAKCFQCRHGFCEKCRNSLPAEEGK